MKRRRSAKIESSTANIISAILSPLLLNGLSLSPKNHARMEIIIADINIVVNMPRK